MENGPYYDDIVEHDWQVTRQTELFGEYKEPTVTIATKKVIRLPKTQVEGEGQLATGYGCRVAATMFAIALLLGVLIGSGLYLYFHGG